MSRRLVLVLDRVGEDLAPETAILEPLGISIEYRSDDRGRRNQQLAEAEALLLNTTVVDAGFLETAPRCRAIVTYGVGHDHIDLQAAQRRKVLVAHVPDYCTEEVADHTIALFLALARGIVRGNAIVRDGKWGVNGVGPLRRLSGRVMGLVGFGRIARAVATRAAAFGLRVVAYDPAFSPGTKVDAIVTFLPTLAALLRESDVVSLHLPLSSGTRGLIDGNTLHQIKRGAILINTSRGGLVDLPAVLDALDDERLAGAGLDVFSDEPPDPKHLTHPNLVVTPHVAYYSTESEEELKVSAARAIAAALIGSPVANVLTQVERIEKELVR